MNEAMRSKPVPHPTADSAPFWDAMNEGRLSLQKCSSCGKIRHYPRPMCDVCYSMKSEWVKGSGRGTIHSWVVCHHAYLPAFRNDTPYTLVTVDLEEGVRMNAMLRNAEGVKLRVGMPVRLAFERVSDKLTLPAFALAG